MGDLAADAGKIFIKVQVASLPAMPSLFNLTLRAQECPCLSTRLFLGFCVFYPFSFGLLLLGRARFGSSNQYRASMAQHYPNSPGRGGQLAQEMVKD